MKGEIRILGLGTVTVDHVLTVSSYPEPDSKNEALASRYQVGGPVPIALSQLRKFNHPTAFLSVWGNDAWGDVIESRFQRDGIDFMSSSRLNISSSVTQIWLDQISGQRTLVTSRVDGNAITDLFDKDYLSQFDVLHLDCWPTEAALKAAQIMKRLGGLVSLDTGSPKAGVEKLLSLADVVNCPQRFCQKFIGETDLKCAAQRISEFGPRLVTVTAGEHGAALSSRGQVHFQPARQLSHAVDTNGAGDSFSGAILHGVLKDWAPKMILNFAITCAGIKCEKLGNEEALPDERTVLSSMESA